MIPSFDLSWPVGNHLIRFHRFPRVTFTFGDVLQHLHIEGGIVDDDSRWHQGDDLCHAEGTDDNVTAHLDEPRRSKEMLHPDGHWLCRFDRCSLCTRSFQCSRSHLQGKILPAIVRQFHLLRCWTDECILSLCAIPPHQWTSFHSQSDTNDRGENVIEHGRKREREAQYLHLKFQIRGIDHLEGRVERSTERATRGIDNARPFSTETERNNVEIILIDTDSTLLGDHIVELHNVFIVNAVCPLAVQIDILRWSFEERLGIEGWISCVTVTRWYNWLGFNSTCSAFYKENRWGKDWATGKERTSMAHWMGMGRRFTTWRANLTTMLKDTRSGSSIFSE